MRNGKRNRKPAESAEGAASGRSSSCRQAPRAPHCRSFRPAIFSLSRALPRVRLAAALLAAAALVSACVGGGGAGSRSQHQPPAPQPSPPPQVCVQTILGCLTPNNYEEERQSIENRHNAKDDFKNQWGLARIRADRAWAQLELEYGIGTAPGSGQTVGLVDSGIDTGHPVFDGKTVTEEFLDGAADETGTRTSHGTTVAAVAAGRPSAAHTAEVRAARGVAWGADVAMFAIPLGPGGDMYNPVSLNSLANNDGDFGAVIDRVLAWSSGTRTLDFVNMSIGFKGIVDQYSAQDLRTGFGGVIAAIAQTGVADKTVFVWAGGNAHGAACNPADFTGNPDLCESYVGNGETRYRVNARTVEFLAGLPALIAELRGHNIAVVAIGQDGRIASFSNRCGSAAQWCLAAPGAGIRTAYFGRHPDTDEPGARGAHSASGTSVAAPAVTGALIVMKHYFRGQMPNVELVTRLLDTAKDSGIYSESAVYGHGLLDLEAATTPVGGNSFALGTTVDGPASQVTQTRFDFGDAFGNVLTMAFAGQEVVAFDAIGAPFWYRLGGFFRAAPRAAATARLDAFLAPESWAPESWAPESWPPGAERRAGPASPGMTAAAADGTAANRRTAPPLLGGFVPAPRRGRRNLLQLGYLDAPAPGLGGGHLSLAGRALAFETDGPGGLGFTVFSTEGMRGRAPVSGALLSWRLPPARSGATAGRPFKLTGGWMAERETVLGSRSAGAFGRLAAGSAFVGFEGGVQAGAWRLDAAAEFGLAYARADGGMVTGVSPLYTSAVALRAERPLADGSRLRFSVSQPLRVEAGRARFSIPVGRTKDRRVLRRSLNVNLAPAGRQIDVSARWRKRLATGGDLRLGATWTLQPGHDAAAASELTFLAGLRHSF